MAYLNGQKILLKSNVTTVNFPIDQTYNPESENAQSGKAVAQALKTVDVGRKSVEYELINTITVAPATDGSLPQYIHFTEDSEGKPFELDNFYVNIKAGFIDGSTATLYVKANNNDILLNVPVGFTSEALRRTCVRFRKLYDGFIECSVNSSCADVGDKYWNSQMNMVRHVFISPPDTKPFETITKVSLYTLLGNNKTWLEGSCFELWGIRK